MRYSPTGTAGRGVRLRRITDQPGAATAPGVVLGIRCADHVWGESQRRGAVVGAPRNCAGPADESPGPAAAWRWGFARRRFGPQHRPPLRMLRRSPARTPFLVHPGCLRLAANRNPGPSPTVRRARPQRRPEGTIADMSRRRCSRWPRTCGHGAPRPCPEAAGPALLARGLDSGVCRRIVSLAHWRSSRRSSRGTRFTSGPHPRANRRWTLSMTALVVSVKCGGRRPVPEPALGGGVRFPRTVAPAEAAQLHYTLPRLARPPQEAPMCFLDVRRFGERRRRIPFRRAQGRRRSAPLPLSLPSPQWGEGNATATSSAVDPASRSRR